MLCLRIMRSLARHTTALREGQSIQKTCISSSTRTFTSLPLRRPTTLSFLPNTTTTPSQTSSTAAATALQQPLDLLPKISQHPALASQQVRNGPRNTYDPSHRVRKRRHGFLARKRTRTGRATLKRRKAKGRGDLSH